MLEWLTTTITAPEAGREIIAKNPGKEIDTCSSVKQCRVINFHKSFSEDMIIKTMLSDGIVLWSYTE